jgi:ThiF family
MRALEHRRVETACVQAPERPVELVVVGAGVIGAHLVGHLARHPEVSKLTIIDRDTYSEANLACQEIRVRDVGRAKASVQARRLSRLRNDLEVRARVADVRTLPLGELRSDAIFSCVDTRVARQVLNQCAYRLGIPWFDTGVKGDQLLARAHVYAPVPGAGCLECGWSDRDYALLEQDYPCRGEREIPTGASSALGALAASMAAIEFGKWVGGRVEHLAVGHQVLIDGVGHCDRLTRFGPNPACRFDHRVWEIVPLDCSAADLTLGQAVELGRLPGSSGPLEFEVDRGRFITGLICPQCGWRDGVFFLGIPGGSRACDECGSPAVCSPAGCLDVLNDAADTRGLTSGVRSRSLAEIGLRSGDVFTVRDSVGERHFEIPPKEVG